MLKPEHAQSAGGSRSRDRQAHRRRGAAPARKDPPHPVGELRLGGGARGLRLGAAEQVLARATRASATTRGSSTSIRSSARHRPRQGAVRRRSRERAAVLGLAGEPRRLPRVLSSPATPSWAWGCPPAATSRTAGTCRSPASTSARSRTACARTPAASISTRCATLAKKEQPKLLWCGGTAIPRTIDFAGVRRRSRTRWARILVADIAHIAGLVAGGAHPSPVPHADVVTTTTHKTLRGPRGGMIMCKAQHAQRDRPGGVPRPAGRAAQPHDRRHRGRAQEASTAAFKKYAHADRRRTPRRSPAS